MNSSGVRYLVVVGLAVVAHGYLRFTAYVDLVIDFDPDNLQRAMEVFQSLGYVSRAPVTLEDFIDARNRAAWTRDRAMTVFSLYSREYPATEIDLFRREARVA